MGEGKFDFKFILTIHFRELDRSEFINSRLSIPITIFLALIAGMFVLFDKVLAMNVIPPTFSMVCLGVSLILLMRASYFFYRTMIGYQYGSIDYLEDIIDYQKKLNRYAIAYFPDNADNKTRELTDNFLKERLISLATRNAKNNDLKAESLHRTHLFLAYAIVPVAVAAILYAIDKLPFGAS